MDSLADICGKAFAALLALFLLAACPAEAKADDKILPEAAHEARV